MRVIPTTRVVDEAAREETKGRRADQDEGEEEEGSSSLTAMEEMTREIEI